VHHRQLSGPSWSRSRMRGCWPAARSRADHGPVRASAVPLQELVTRRAPRAHHAGTIVGIRNTDASCAQRPRLSPDHRPQPTTASAVATSPAPVSAVGLSWRADPGRFWQASKALHLDRRSYRVEPPSSAGSMRARRAAKRDASRGFHPILFWLRRPSNEVSHFFERLSYLYLSHRAHIEPPIYRGIVLTLRIVAKSPIVRRKPNSGRV